MKLLLVALAACASTADNVKGPLQPFAPAGITSPRSGKRFALAIGIDQFIDERFTTLEFAAADAKALAASLENFDEVRVLAKKSETTRASILEAIADLGARASSEKDTVLIYLSSHGSLGHRPGGQLERFLVARDTRLDLVADTGISVNALLAAIDQIPARAKVVFLATCHSGAGKSRLPDRVADALQGTKAPLLPLDRVSEATMIFTAAAFGEAAKESRELGHDVYTHFILEAFQHGDADGDGAITASEAHDYARRRTYEFTGGAQRPSAEVSILGEDPIVLAGQRLRSPLPVIYSYAASAEGLRLVIDGRDKGTLPGGIAIEAGGHEIELRDGEDVLYRGTISASHGDRIEVSGLVPPPPRIALALSTSAFLPLGSRAGDLVPRSFGAGALATIDHLLFEGSLIGFRFDGRGGRGYASGLGEYVPFDFMSFGGTLLLGYGPDFRNVRIRGDIELGVHYFRRSFDTATFSSVQSSAVFTLDGGAIVTWCPTPLFEIGARIGGGAFFFASEPRAYPHLLLSLWVGATL